MTELQQPIWTCLLLVFVNERMQNVTGLSELTIENHAKMISLRRARDLTDIKRIFRYIKPLEPKRKDSKLLIVVTGVHMSLSVSAHNDKSVVEVILKDMEAKDTEKYVSTKNEKAVTMTEK